MIESNLKEGNQKLSDNLEYGKSITDGCVNLETTYNMLLKLNNVTNNTLYYPFESK